MMTAATWWCVFNLCSYACQMYAFSVILLMTLFIQRFLTFLLISRFFTFLWLWNSFYKFFLHPCVKIRLRDTYGYGQSACRRSAKLGQKNGNTLVQTMMQWWRRREVTDAAAVTLATAAAAAAIQSRALQGCAAITRKTLQLHAYIW